MTEAYEFKKVDKREPPLEVLLWPFGKRRTAQGEFELSRETAEKQVRRMDTLGITRDRPTFDVGSIVAWARTEVREDGLWATKIDWLEEKLRAIPGDLYLAPSITHNKGEILDIFEARLTNHPARAE